MNTKTEQFKLIAPEAKEAKWESFCEELSAETMLSILPTNGRECSYQNNIRLRRHQQGKTNEEKGQAFLGRVVQQSNQNHLEERKHVISDLNRTLAQSSPDDELTREEFNEVLRRSGKDTAPGPDRIQY